MSVLTIIFPVNVDVEHETLISSLNDTLLSTVHSQSINSTEATHECLYQLVDELQDSYHIIHIKPNLPYFDLSKHGEIIYKASAQWLATHIVQYYEPILLKQSIKAKGFTNDETISKIEMYCQSILSHEQWDGLSRIYTEADRKRRIGKIVHELTSYFSYEVICQVDGMLKFRLKPYKKEIRDIVEYACDEYILNQQYEEFISLIKYFVQIQECKLEMVHLFQDDKGLELYDEELNSIVINDYEDRIIVDMLETEINIEDSVISHLVAVSPKKIVLHQQAAELYETKTLLSIFSDRVEVCTGCHLCKTHSEIMPN